ncbi:DNA-MISMATCH-REPAIR-2 domain-containing protein [Sulfidibacter corallicola]|uniref:DNA mismatch repair proteins mutS family domain-containing protein n=1 Tax=Sulfidibacter corallicola TaxID=2818388 RepID=A0A8A4TVS8_SULCO|nr:hypothetical protein [Sulfidibacter corallicola]QTD53234.1 hypothetical protein J3U87_12325 [Sulfidibacter corallicola]
MPLAPEQVCTRRIQAYDYRARRMQARINRLAVIRLVVFLVLVVSGSLLVAGGARWLGMVLFPFAAGAFLFLMVVHDRCYRFRDRCRFLKEAAENDLARATCRPKDVVVEEPIAFEDNHPFAHDLDLSAPFSTLKLLDNSFHRRTKNLLKRWIDTGIDDRASAAEITARQRAVDELAEKKRFRHKLLLTAHLDSDRELNPEELEAWLQVPVPWTLSTPAYLLGRILVAITVGVVGLAFLLNTPAIVAAVPGLIGLRDMLDGMILPVVGFQLLVFFFLDFFQKPFYAAFMSRGRAITATCNVIQQFEKIRPKAEPLIDLRERLLVDGRPAGTNLLNLLAIHERLQYRANGFAHFLLNGLFLWDQHQLRRLARWRGDFGDRLPEWAESIFEMEALAALANFRALFPQYPFPEVTDEDQVHIEAVDLGHPTIPPGSRIGNDYRLVGNGHMHLVTGSNMSGKSTFLRTCGVNLVLARMGAPVCATALTCNVPRIWTSIRIQDSLSEGVSYFYAEVKRIKLILDQVARDDAPVFYLLDEILKGTNSRERLIACKAMVAFLIDHKAAGLITTHDLELLSLEQDYQGEILNYHFQENIRDETMFFDYTLKRGRLTSTNALRVLRFAKVPLEFDE